jgi:RNA-directed DNA polymerase
MKTPKDVADLLELDLDHLHYHIYVVSDSSKYTTFKIPKKTGGVRTISAPITPLKIVQRKLNQVLLSVYKPKPCVYSFLPQRSIVGNARIHARRWNILNIDLEDFFPSINFGRVRGLFIGPPYQLDPKIATVLAQICCFNNQLPQGAPTSPIVSNMICAKMDSQLIALAKANRCNYTRYADDLTFSTNIRQFPTALASVNMLAQTDVGSELLHVISDNGFKVNPDKVKLRNQRRRQEVTGLTVNMFPNPRRTFVRQTRAMLHAWEKFGLTAAEADFHNHHDKKHRNPKAPPVSFKRVVKGKIDFLGMVRGKQDIIYLRLAAQLNSLAPELIKQHAAPMTASTAAPTKVSVCTEGKSDWKHLKAALQWLKQHGEYPQIDVQFAEYSDDMGDTKLLKMCKFQCIKKQDHPTIQIFDRDNHDITKKASGSDGNYKDWGNNIYSFVIPVPQHRFQTPSISIEFYYTDSEIMRQDKVGRRLFLSTEFMPPSGWHASKKFIYTYPGKLKKDQDPFIVDTGVYDDHEQPHNVALPKDDFADYVLKKEVGFDDFDFSQFRAIFDVIALIATKA